MKPVLRMLVVAAFAMFSMPQMAVGAPDEVQKQLIQRAQDAKKKLAGAQAAKGTERQKMMSEHMKMMQDMMAQMQKAKPGAGMSPEKMREWIDEHMALMHEMMGQMSGQHHMMMDGMKMEGMHGAGKKQAAPHK